MSTPREHYATVTRLLKTQKKITQSGFIFIVFKYIATVYLR